MKSIINISSMYSLIKSICYYYNSDVGLLIYRLYNRIIDELLKNDVSNKSRFLDTNICYINRVQTYKTRKTFCFGCHSIEFYTSGFYKQITYLDVIYRNTGLYVCHGSKFRTYHLECFEEKFGAIYDFEVNRRDQVKIIKIAKI